MGVVIGSVLEAFSVYQNRLLEFLDLYAEHIIFIVTKIKEILVCGFVSGLCLKNFVWLADHSSESHYHKQEVFPEE